MSTIKFEADGGRSISIDTSTIHSVNLYQMLDETYTVRVATTKGAFSRNYKTRLAADTALSPFMLSEHVGSYDITEPLPELTGVEAASTAGLSRDFKKPANKAKKKVKG